MFSKSCEYAIRATIYIYKQHQHCACKVSIDEIAEEIQSPRPFTAKILQILSRQNIISSVKGPNGGFYMTHEQGKTPVLEVARTIDGVKTLRGCVLGLQNCDEQHPCPMHQSYKPIREALLILFQGNTIAALSDKLNEQTTFLSV